MPYGAGLFGPEPEPSYSTTVMMPYVVRSTQHQNPWRMSRRKTTKTTKRDACLIMETLSDCSQIDEVGFHNNGNATVPYVKTAIRFPSPHVTPHHWAVPMPDWLTWLDFLLNSSSHRRGWVSSSFPDVPVLGIYLSSILSCPPFFFGVCVCVCFLCVVCVCVFLVCCVCVGLFVGLFLLLYRSRTPSFEANMSAVFFPNKRRGSIFRQTRLKWYWPPHALAWFRVFPPASVVETPSCLVLSWQTRNHAMPMSLKTSPSSLSLSCLVLSLINVHPQSEECLLNLKNVKNLKVHFLSMLAPPLLSLSLSPSLHARCFVSCHVMDTRLFFFVLTMPCGASC